MRRRRLLASLVAMVLVGAVAPTPAGAVWTAPLTLSAGGQNASVPQVAVEVHGNAVFTWQRFDGTHQRIQARARSADGTLSPIQTLSTGGQNAFGPQVAGDAQGNAVFTWQRLVGTNYRIQARARSADGTLSPVQTLSAAGQNADSPRVAVDARGNAVFTWRRSDGTNVRIQARARSADGTLSPIQTLSPAGQGAPRNPQVGVSPQGKAIFTWNRFVPSSTRCCQRVEARGRSAAGALSPVQTLSRPPAPDQNASFPQVGVDPHGNAVFTWIFAYGGGRINADIEARARTAAGALSPIQTISPPGGSGGQAYSPQVAVDIAGEAVFTWARTSDYLPESPHFIETRARSADGALSFVQTLSSEQGTRGPQVGMDSTGDAVFTWERFDGTHYSVQARARFNTGALGPIQTLSVAGRNARLPQVAVGGGGDAVVTWQRFNGTNWVIQAAAGP